MAGGRRCASATCARPRTSSGSSRRPLPNDGLSICVTAAGLNRPGPTLEQPIDDFDLVVETNLRGTYLTCRAFAAAIGGRGRGGRIVAISSQMGEVGYPGRAAYCASKHAVNGLVRALAVEWAPVGITVNAVAPTFVDTPLTRPMFEDEAFRADVLGGCPWGASAHPQTSSAPSSSSPRTRPRS